jgi:spermidine/putrescine transport system permease protein
VSAIKMPQTGMEQLRAAITTTDAPVAGSQSGVRVATRPPRSGISIPGWLGENLLRANAVLLFFFLYAPILILILFSFNDSKSGVNWAGFTTRWYDQLFHDTEMGAAAMRTLIVATISTAVSTIVGTLAALALERYRFIGKTMFEGVMYLPIIIPEIVMGLSLLLFFVAVGTQRSLVTVTIAHIVFNIPFVAVIVRARLHGFDKRLEEAAMDLGANELETFRRITLPLLMPGIIGGALMAFTLSIDDVIVTQFTAGPNSTTLPLKIYDTVKVGITPEVNAVSTLLLLASIVLVLGSLLLQREKKGK